jgi:hypothetical protein
VNEVSSFKLGGLINEGWDSPSGGWISTMTDQSLHISWSQFNKTLDARTSTLGHYTLTLQAHWSNALAEW